MERMRGERGWDGEEGRGERMGWRDVRARGDGNKREK